MTSISFRINRRGATLPLTIIVLALMGVAVAITFGRISAERVITSDQKAQQGAFAVAQSGLNRFLSTINGKPAIPVGWPANPVIQTVNYNDLPGGTAQVHMAMLRDSTPSLWPLPAVYVITSRGRYTAAKRWNTRVPVAERTVATYALWTPAPFDLNAGVTALAGMELQGASVNTHLSGVDACGANANIPGVAVPTNGYIGAAGPIDGNPDNTAVGMGAGGVGGAASTEVKIDWASIVAGTKLPPNYQGNPPAWPNPAQFDQWPIVKVNNTAGPAFDMPANGKGILIVTGDLLFSGAVRWDGLILVGGKMTSNGNNQVYGATITGLNVKLGIVPNGSYIANGAKIYQYDSCALARALGKQGSIQRLRNGWTDTWSSF